MEDSRTLVVDMRLVEAVKERFPFLNLVNDESEIFYTLVTLISEMAVAEYRPEKKYSLMYKVIKIANILNSLAPPALKDKTTATADLLKTEKCTLAETAKDLTHQQQFVLFKVSRTIPVEFFHGMSEDVTRNFLGNFIGLCNGINISSHLIKLRSDFNALMSGANIHRAIKAERAELSYFRLRKLFCQIGYFLDKIRNLGAADLEASCMAVSAVGMCARNFHYFIVEHQRTLLVPRPKQFGLDNLKKNLRGARNKEATVLLELIKITERLSVIRENFAHNDCRAETEKEIMGHCQELIECIPEMLADFEAKANNFLNLHAAPYYQVFTLREYVQEKGEASPRAYEEDVFMKRPK